jgi:hypothetical protein
MDYIKSNIWIVYRQYIKSSIYIYITFIFIFIFIFIPMTTFRLEMVLLSTYIGLTSINHVL